MLVVVAFTIGNMGAAFLVGGYSGQRVEEKVDKNLIPGRYAFLWCAKNESHG